MHFDPTDDQAAIRDSVRKFARAELAPGYLARAKSTDFPWELHRRVSSLGAFGLLAGPEFNPLPDEDYVAAGLLVEEPMVSGEAYVALGLTEPGAGSDVNGIRTTAVTDGDGS